HRPAIVRVHEENVDTRILRGIRIKAVDVELAQVAPVGTWPSLAGDGPGVWRQSEFDQGATFPLRSGRPEGRVRGRFPSRTSIAAAQQCRLARLSLEGSRSRKRPR